MLETKFIRTFAGIAILIASLWVWPAPVIAQPVPLHSSNPSARLFDDTILVKYWEASFHNWNPVQRKAKMAEIAATFSTIPALSELTVLRTMPHLGVQQLQLGPGQSLNTVILLLRHHPQVRYAEYNFRVIAAENPPPPNDLYWRNGYLWGLSKIRMGTAWAHRTDASNIVVAVLDSGIDYQHPDLIPNMWTDSVPPSHGINTCANEQGPMATDPMDLNGHGTMVAEIIGAKGNNDDSSFGVKVVGVNWDVKLLAAKILCGGQRGEIPHGSVADAEQGIEYAIEKHADILNNSWRMLPPIDQNDIQILREAVRRTNCEVEVDDELPPQHCKRALFVAASGNAHGKDGSLDSDNINGKVYPANFPINNIIAVAATDADDNLWPGSHYGINSVPIAAPGVDIDSTYLRTQGDGFSVLSGTSMAAPHVAGCAALLQAQSLAASGSPRSIESLKSKLLNSADSIDALSAHITNGRRLNCGRALTIRPHCPYCGCPFCGPDELSVQFRPRTESSRIKSLNGLLGVEIVQTLADRQVIVKIPTDKSLDEMRGAYSAFPEVESVSLGK